MQRRHTREKKQDRKLNQRKISIHHINIHMFFILKLEHKTN